MIKKEPMLSTFMVSRLGKRFAIHYFSVPLCLCGESLTMVSHTPMACWIAFAMASVWRRIASSVSASIITRASFSVPE